jgi:hypothetical protein
MRLYTPLDNYVYVRTQLGPMKANRLRSVKVQERAGAPSSRLTRATEPREPSGTSERSLKASDRRNFIKSRTSPHQVNKFHSHSEAPRSQWRWQGISPPRPNRWEKTNGRKGVLPWVLLLLTPRKTDLKKDLLVKFFNRIAHRFPGYCRRQLKCAQYTALFPLNWSWAAGRQVADQSLSDFNRQLDVFQKMGPRQANILSCVLSRSAFRIG